MGRGVVYQKSAAQRRQERVVSIIVAERTWLRGDRAISGKGGHGRKGFPY